MTSHEAILLGEKSRECREVLAAAFVAMKEAMVAKMLSYSVALGDEAEVISMHKSISLIDGLEAAIDTFITTGSMESLTRQAQAAEQED